MKLDDLSKIFDNFLILFVIILIRYFLIAGGTYLFFYSVLGKSFVKRMQRKPPLPKAIQGDIQLAILSTGIFALCAVLILLAYDLNITLLYTAIYKYGLWYLGVSFLAVLILQDAFFYFVHRAFHHPLFFKWLHYGHHRSGEPTPWTSFAFDPLEAFVQGLFLVSVVFIVPLHIATLVALLITMTLWAILTHLGFKVSSSSFFHQWLGKWLIGSTYHLIHHQRYTVHYGLYFTFWDKLFGTHTSEVKNESYPLRVQ